MKKEEEIRKKKEEFKEKADGIIKKMDGLAGEIVNTYDDMVESITSLEVEHFREHLYFLKGIALGLFYGIVGNIFVSHYYQVFEGLILSRFDVLYWSNFVVFVVALILIILVTMTFYFQIEKLRTEGERKIEEWKKLQMNKMEKITKEKDKLLREYDSLEEDTRKEIYEKY